MILIQPENPSSDDNVEFTFYLHCPYYEGIKTIAGSQFILNARAPESVPCVSTSPPVPYTWSVGRIPAGEYQAILNYPYGDEEYQAFSVTQGQSPFPAPSIPTLGIPAAILLVVVLGWLANKSLKRTRKRAA